jgi:purine-binding chemotaxis protein CheW
MMKFARAMAAGMTVYRRNYHVRPMQSPDNTSQSAPHIPASESSQMPDTLDGRLGFMQLGAAERTAIQALKSVVDREIRGRGKSTPLPHLPREVLGVLDLRGAVIPIIDPATMLGMESAGNSERSAIVGTEVSSGLVGLVIDGASDLLSVDSERVQPLSASIHGRAAALAHGMITHEIGMTCFLDLDRLFPGGDALPLAA